MLHQQRYLLRVLDVGVVPVMDSKVVAGTAFVTICFPFLEAVFISFGGMEDCWVMGKGER